jgi:hypothetical protein
VSATASLPLRARGGALPARFLAPLWIAAGAGVLRLVAGVGFVNYDTLYALAWGGQLARGQTPAYGVAIAPTPHPLLELLGLVLSPLPPRVVCDVTIALAFLALAACGWVLYRLGSTWFGRGAGALAAVLFLTRVPVLSYGVRAYADVPYVLFVLTALLVAVRRPRSAVPVLALLALAGLLRPEAWVFAGAYWLYATGSLPAALWRRLGLAPAPRPDPRRLLLLSALAAAAPVIWLASDAAITGDALWSLTNTRHTATTLGRVKGIANVPEYVPRRIGEILQGAVLASALAGALLAVAWLRRRALPCLVAAIAAVAVFALFAAFGLPIDTRYGFLAAAILCLLAGAALAGWTALPQGSRRRAWAAVAGALVVALIATAPSQYRSAHRELGKLERQARIEGDLLSLVSGRAVTLRCGPVGVPNHAPIPLLALYLHTSPARILNAQVGRIATGVYVDPASRQVEDDYVLDPRDPHVPVGVPPGFSLVGGDRSWRVFRRCQGG